MSTKQFFTENERSSIKETIMMAELDTSGEIRVHVDETCKGDPLDRANYWFQKLGMHKTEQHNGVLFYLAIKDRKFAIVGDKGIHNRVDEHFWDTIKADLLLKFRAGSFAQGLCEGIDQAGKQLKTFFPFQSDDKNELADDISFGEETQA